VYQPDTQRTLLAKEGTNGIWPVISQFSKRAGFFYIPQAGTRDRVFYFPSEGRHAVDFFGKIRRLWSGANPRSWVPEAGMLTTRLPKPLYRSLSAQRLSKQTVFSCAAALREMLDSECEGTKVV
jgi:hypothetical protein